MEPLLPPQPAVKPFGHARELRNLVFLTLILALCFIKPLFHLVRFAANSDLYSYILLVPFISLYLVWLKRKHPLLPSEPDRRPALFPFAAGALTLLFYWFAVRSGLRLLEDDYLAWMVLAFVLFFLGNLLVCLGTEPLRRLFFPIAFLIFLIPFPAFLEKAIEGFLQRGSADVANALFNLVGTPVLRHGLAFQLPGFSLQVAPECSGIHSTMVLFMTSLVAGQFFLRASWKRAVLALAIVPLSLLRNGLRIVTIGELCVHVNPDMINSYIHKRGGPIFFVLSLVPLFLLLYYLRRSELKNNPEPIVRNDSPI